MLWSCLFAGIALLCATLPFFASEQAWSVVTNFLCWALIAAFFFGEWAFRLWHFRQVEHPSLLQYLQLVVQTDVRRIG